MLKKILSAVGVLALTVGLVTLVAGPASAHTHKVTATCQAGVDVNLTNYSSTTPDDTLNNVTVVIDGDTVVNNVAFGTTFTNTYVWPVIPAASHSYQVIVTAYDHVDKADDYNLNTGVVTVPNCAQSTSAGDVTYTNPYCAKGGGVGSGGYTIPNILEAVYTVSVVVGGTTTTGVKAPGTYPAPAGAVIHVTAAPASSAYTITGPTHPDGTIGTIDETTCATPAKVCVPNSAVSYTYDPATNSGRITVVDNARRSSGVLCNPFWVTATSWKYTTSGVWPQTRDVVQKLPQITKTGSYDYSAEVGCGQGDIYASFTAQPDPTPTLIGPGNPFTEDFLSSMGFSGPSFPTYTLRDPGCYLAPAVTAYPAYTNSICDANNAGTLLSGFYTIPDAVNVHFKTSVNGSAFADVASGKYRTKAGDVVKAQVIADTGFALDPVPDAAKLEHAFPAADPFCGSLITSPLVDPSATPVPLGCETDGSYTLSNSLGDPAAIVWTVNGAPVTVTKAATDPILVKSAGIVTIHAEANGPKYGLESDAQQDWTFDFERPSSCDLTTLALQDPTPVLATTGTTPMGWIVLGYLMLISGLGLIAVRFAHRRGEQA